MLEPISKDIGEGEEIFLGTMGPGQTLQVEFDPWIYDSKGVNVGHYDLVNTTSLPEDWKSTESKLYGDPLQLTITSSEFEEEGTYDVTINIIDEDGAEGIGDIEFIGKIKIQHDILDISVQPEKITTGANQPARYYITVVNKGSANDVFEIESENIPKWRFKKYVYIPAMSSKTVLYEIVEKEEESFKPIIVVTSTSSSIIQEEKELTLEVRTDILNDFKATNHGTPIFPILEAPIFALMGLLSNLW